MLTGFKIKDISVEVFEASDKELPKHDDGRPAGYIQVASSTGINFKEKKLASKIEIELFPGDADADGNKTRIGRIQTVVIFSVEDWNANVTEINGKMDVSRSTRKDMFQIGYDTTRGILKERGRGTAFGNVLLPLVDPETIVD